MSRKLAQIEFMLHWQSECARHRDGLFAGKVNFWRDFLPPAIEALQGREAGATARAPLEPGDSIPEHRRERVISLRNNQFDRHAVPHMTLEPEPGRFYPVGFLKGLPGYFKGDLTPARCVDADGERLRFDVNHPLAGRRLELAATLVHREELPGQETGGACFDWAEATASGGPGMQARDAPGALPDADGLRRMDEDPDDRFYAAPRLVPHIDARASAHIARLYRELLRPGQRVLDLMGSWQSHLPDDLVLDELVGLGMNDEELAQNPRLDQRLVHDLNADPALPFGDDRFDAVICNLSVEYLTRPQPVFAEVGRVLRPGGLFVTTFSNRWFPPKVIQRWQQLHEFERMGLVLDYFLAAGGFAELETWSMRGWPRPADDRYADQLAESDPVYAVWGRTKR